MDHFELLIELETNLRIWYKDGDQFNSLLKIDLLKKSKQLNFQ